MTRPDRTFTQMFSGFRSTKTYPHSCNSVSATATSAHTALARVSCRRCCGELLSSARRSCPGQYVMRMSHTLWSSLSSTRAPCSEGSAPPARDEREIARITSSSRLHRSDLCLTSSGSEAPCERTTVLRAHSCPQTRTRLTLPKPPDSTTTPARADAGPGHPTSEHTSRKLVDPSPALAVSLAVSPLSRNDRPVDSSREGHERE
mmetsp:Transcript_17186/g.56270  ORF Transcript_17186/g.56270 Transcript_17186/m.56270 type:complete len:204 (-) Transcript_17186:35-646(-)